MGDGGPERGAQRGRVEREAEGQSPKETENSARQYEIRNVQRFRFRDSAARLDGGAAGQKRKYSIINVQFSSCSVETLPIFLKEAPTPRRGGGFGEGTKRSRTKILFPFFLWPRPDSGAAKGRKGKAKGRGASLVLPPTPSARTSRYPQIQDQVPSS